MKLQRKFVMLLVITMALLPFWYEMLRLCEDNGVIIWLAGNLTH